jgi:hypothetical protein
VETGVFFLALGWGLRAQPTAQIQGSIQDASGGAVPEPTSTYYAKRVADEDSLMAVIMAQAMNLGNHGMSETSDIPYHSLEAAHQQYSRLSTLKSANERISHFFAGLAIFPQYSFDWEVLYGSVDG